MVRRLAAVVLCLALVGSACSKKSNTTTPKATANTYTVQIDAKKPGQSLNVFALAYFPDSLTIHPGDTVEFKLNWSGEPHTVTFGSLVDQGLPKVSPSQGAPEPAEWQQLPHLISPGKPMPQSAAQPCFLTTGAPPDPAACTADQQKQPDFDGKATFYNAGFLPEGSPSFTVKFASTVAPGDYHYFCLLHRARMTGKVTVVASSATAQKPADVLAAGDAAIAKEVSDLGGPAQSIASAGAGIVHAGITLPPPSSNQGLGQFGPKDVSIAVGGTVSWDVVGPHTVSINPPTDASPAVVKQPDGSWGVNPKAFAPVGGAGFQGTPGVKATVDAGVWDGTGYHNSGLLPGFGPPGTLTYTLKFAKAGTYSYKCLIHTDMEGTVKVG